MTILRKIACALDYIKHWLSKDKCKGCKHLELCAWREKDKQLQCGLCGGDWCKWNEESNGHNKDLWTPKGEL